MALRRRALPLGALLFSSSLGCLFPEYTFDEPEPTGATSSSSSSSSSTGGEAGGGQGGGGGTTGPVEDCFSPGDEDADGDADCADADCTADLECVPAVPAGWGAFGHVALLRASANEDPPCPAGTTTTNFEGNASLQDDASTCSACSCGAPAGRTCALTQDLNAGKDGLQAAQIRGAVCAEMVAPSVDEATVPAAWDGTCSALDTLPGGQQCDDGDSGLTDCNQSAFLAAATVSGGSCTPAGGEPPATTPTWAERGEACRVDAALMGCALPSVCAPKPPPPWQGRVCVGKAGDVACPAGYPRELTFHDDFDDQRACSACTCGDPSGGSCKITVTLYAEDDCSGTSVGAVESGSCEDLTGNPTIGGRTAAVTSPPSGGGCAVTGGGVASGSVLETDPTTFCCLP